MIAGPGSEKENGGRVHVSWGNVPDARMSRTQMPNLKPRHIFLIWGMMFTGNVRLPAPKAWEDFFLQKRLRPESITAKGAGVFFKRKPSLQKALLPSVLLAPSRRAAQLPHMGSAGPSRR